MVRRPKQARTGSAARFVKVALRRAATTGRELLSELRAAGRPLAAGRLRDLMGNLMDSGLVRVRDPSRGAFRDGGRRYALAARRKGRSGSGKCSDGSSRERPLGAGPGEKP